MSDAQLGIPGSFCWSESCPDSGKVNHGNIRRFGKTRKGVHRYQCKTCKATFTETRGTVFYGCHTSQETILECLALLVERNSLAAIHRVKGIKEETVMSWLCKAAHHVEQVEELLLANYSLSRAQLDALWTFVGHKGEKGGTRRRMSKAASGVAPR